MPHRTLTWQCLVCASPDLRVFDHAFCPNCGHERDVEATRWADVGPDRFAGTDLHCCDRDWSADALFCGRCGEAFLQVEDEPRSREVTDLGDTDLLASLGLAEILAMVVARHGELDEFWDESSDLGVITGVTGLPPAGSTLVDDLPDA